MCRAMYYSARDVVDHLVSTGVLRAVLGGDTQVCTDTHTHTHTLVCAANTHTHTPTPTHTHRTHAYTGQ